MLKLNVAEWSTMMRADGFQQRLARVFADARRKGGEFWRQIIKKQPKPDCGVIAQRQTVGKSAERSGVEIRRLGLETDGEFADVMQQGQPDEECVRRGSVGIIV